jgi:parallel beta-helix repeat protein
MWIPKQANWVRVQGLLLDGRNRDRFPSPTVDSHHDQFLENEVTNYHTAICFELGDAGGVYGQARHTLIERNRIHDCGVLPATNHDHGIYIANSVQARILNNWIYNNADRGIQLYPDAQRTTIAGNVIDHNGEGIIFSGDDGRVSNNNTIAGNSITNSTIRADVESYWPSSARGRGNLVTGNCVHGGRQTIDSQGGGFTARSNVDIDPQYVNAASGDYVIPPWNVCARLAIAAKDGQVRKSVIAHEVAALRPRHHHRSLWARARVERRAHRAVRLVVTGGLTHAMRRSRVKIAVYGRIGRSWRKLAVFHRGPIRTFRLIFRLGKRSRRPKAVRVTMRVDGRRRSATARVH